MISARRLRVPRERRIRFPVASPVGGLRHDLGATFIPPGSSPTCSGVIFRDGVLKKMKGVSPFADPFTEEYGAPSPIVAINYINNSLIVHTLSNVFVLVNNVLVDITSRHAHSTTLNDFISAAYFGGLYIWSNGVDQMRKWDYASSEMQLLANTEYYRAKWILPFGGRLVLYGMIEGGNEYPRRIRYSAVEKPEDYVEVGSGAHDITMLTPDDEIQRAEPLAGVVAVYGKKAIGLQEYVGEYLVPFTYHGRVDGVGLAAPRALVNIEGNKHIFLGWDDIYMFRGGMEVERLGAAVKDELFRRISTEYVHRSFAYYLPEEEVVRFHVPVDGSALPNACYEYHLLDKNWTSLPFPFYCQGRHVVREALTWDTIVGAWEECALTWDSRTLLSLQPITLLGDTEGVVHVSDESAYSLSGEPISAYWDSKDFSIDKYLGHTVNWMELGYEARGTSMDVYYSVDSGESYHLLKSVELESSWTKGRIDFDVTSPKIRFRFAHNALQGTFEVRWFEVGYVSASDRRVEE